MEFDVTHYSVNHTANITGNANYWVKIVLICFFFLKTVYFYFLVLLFCFVLRQKSPYVDQKLPM